MNRKRELTWISPDNIVANDNNPRAERAFTPDELVTLRRSIMTHGVLEPIIITPYKGDTYKLIEGERRWTSARIEGIKEIPAIIVGRMTDSEELTVMFNVHGQRRGWEHAEELRAIQRMIEENPGKSDTELATELGMKPATFRGKRMVVGMGEPVLSDIGAGKLDYYAALRVGELTTTFNQTRPDVVASVGGETEVRDRLLSKARSRKGITRELENIRHDARDRDAVPDDVLEAYIKDPAITISEARSKSRTLAERRAVEDLIKQIHRLNSDLRVFDVDYAEAPNLTDLRKSLASLIATAQGIEKQIVDVTVKRLAG